jgi:hypothetical protein
MVSNYDAVLSGAIVDRATGRSLMRMLMAQDVGLLQSMRKH